MNFSETLKRDKNINELIWFDNELFNEEYIEYNKSNSICFNSYATDDARKLSNHYGCRITYNGIEFNSVEQIYNFMRYYSHPDVRNDIMKMNNPSEIKNKCNRYYKLLYPDINLQTTGFKTNLLFFAQRLKIQQNPDIAKVITERLIKYKSLEIIPPIVEYTWWNDTKNGTVDVDASLVGDYHNGTVRGQNRSGRMLRRCYQELRKGLLDNVINPPYEYVI